MHRVSHDQNFCLKLEDSHGEHMLKISKRYLNPFLNNHQFTKKFLSTSALVQAIFAELRQNAWTKADAVKNFSVNQWLFRNHFRYLFEIFSICLSYKFPNLRQKFWSLLTWYNSSALFYAKTLKASNGHICWHIFKKNFLGWF